MIKDVFSYSPVSVFCHLLVDYVGGLKCFLFVFWYLHAFMFKSIDKLE